MTYPIDIFFETCLSSSLVSILVVSCQRAKSCDKLVQLIGLALLITCVLAIW